MWFNENYCLLTFINVHVVPLIRLQLSFVWENSQAQITIMKLVDIANI